jgi:hypothetical protein
MNQHLGKPTPAASLRPRSRGLAALRLREMCPLLPVDVFVHGVGLNSCSAAYQQLARLRQAGLAEVQRVDPGYLLGERPLGLWRITPRGRLALDVAGVERVGNQPREHGQVRQRPHSSSNNLISLLAAYRLLALVVMELATDDHQVNVSVWEWPWVRQVWSPSRNRFLRVSLPAGAVLEHRETATQTAAMTGWRTPVLLVPDLGTAPVVRYRESLRRLVALLGSRLDSGTHDTQPDLVIATPDPDRDGTRSKAWFELLARVARREEQPALSARIVVWDRVAEVVGRARVPGETGNTPLKPGGMVGCPAPAYPWRAPRRLYEQLLHLIGRHPFLTIHQLTDLLGASTARVRRLQNALVAKNWLRRIELDEVPHGALAIGQEEYSKLGLVEITLVGRRQLALWLGLETAPAVRYHGLIGNSPAQAGLRRRLLRALAHTLGTNAVFVALSMAAETATRHGGADQLAEWG